MARAVNTCRSSLIPVCHMAVVTLILATFAPRPDLLAQQFTDQSSSRFPSPALSEYSNQVAVADLDGDGDLDIAFANGSGFFSAQQQQRLRLYINDGNGFFSDESVARGASLSFARDIEFGDVDGDGDVDGIVANDFNRLAILLINDGNGFFSDESSSRLPQIPLSSPHAAFGDVDNDGDLDLWMCKGGASRFGAGQAQLWLNDGAGFFSNATATQLPSLILNSPMDCIFGDLDGDFDLDLVEGHRDTPSRLFRNDGAGFFTDITAGNLPADSSTYSYDLGDLDADGDLDLLGVNSAIGSAREVLLINDGNASFANMTAAWLPFSENPSVDDNDSKFFDADDDGDLDFVIGSLGSAERICINDGSSYDWIPSLIQSIGDSTMDVEMGDFDGDGTFDMVTAQGESGSFINRLYMNSGPADTTPPVFPAIEQIADAIDLSGPFVVRVIIRDGMTSDHNFFTQGVPQLHFSIDGGVDQTVPLVWSGGDVYRAVLPGGTPGQVSYFAEATDFAGNTGTSSTLSFVLGGGFDRGDCNGDAAFDLSDVVFALSRMFVSGPSSTCEDTCDMNDDGTLDISDAVAGLNSLFQGAGPLPPPFGTCGDDPTADGIDCVSGPCP